MNDAFNYVAVLVSIIVGLSATRVMSGLGEVIQAANRPRIYWVHVLWHITLLFNVMLGWWLLYRWRLTSDWTFFLFMWITIAPILAYLAAAVLIPGELEKRPARPTGMILLQEPARVLLRLRCDCAARHHRHLTEGPAAFPRARAFLPSFHRLLDDRLPRRCH